MRVHIISDMEGVSGIVKPEQTSGGDPMYEEGRKLYTEEINAAVRGAKAGGATEIVVMDCHGAGGGWTFNSLIPELLTRLRVGRAGGVDGLHRVPGAGLRRGALRRHAREGRDAAREHEPHRLGPRLSARSGSTATEVGETGINAALCGTWGCPVLLVTGDEASCDEGKALLGDGLTTVAVKQGLRPASARQIPPVRARQLIEEGAQKALADLKAVPPYDPGSPCEIKVEFKRTQPADRLRFHPGRRAARRPHDPRRGAHLVGSLEDVLLRNVRRATRPASSTRGGSFVRGINRKVLTAAFAVALAGSSRRRRSPFSAPATAAGAGRHLSRARTAMATRPPRPRRGSPRRAAPSSPRYRTDRRPRRPLDQSRLRDRCLRRGCRGRRLDDRARHAARGGRDAPDRRLHAQEATGDPTGEPLFGLQWDMTQIDVAEATR